MFILHLILRAPDEGTIRGEAYPSVLSLDGLPTIGAETAPVVLVLFSDFECSLCIQFARDLWPEIKAKWVTSGHVRVAFRHLQTSTSFSRSALAAVCAHQQDRFWPLYDALFAGAPALSPADIATYSDAHLDSVTLRQCMEQGRALDTIDQDRTVAAENKISGAPAVLIGRRQRDGTIRRAGIMGGVPPVEQVDKMIVTVSGLTTS